MTFRVVIAEDEPLTRRDLAEMLTEMGHQVVGQARDGRAALDLVKETDPDLVLLDLMMPELDGIEAARRLSKERPVIIITAHSSPADRRSPNAAWRGRRRRCSWSRAPTAACP